MRRIGEMTGMIMELYTGRPENTVGRLPREIRTYDFLDKLGIEYVRTDHEPATNMQACDDRACTSQERIKDTLFHDRRNKFLKGLYHFGMIDEEVDDWCIAF